MPEAFSFRREYDYIRLEGLSRVTGRPAHEWDIYIVKELIDNALDADESLWEQQPELFPSIAIKMKYIPLSTRQYQQMIVRVRNRKPFPIERIRDIFSTEWYTSSNAFFQSLTRGALGNALKTLLGIPYALHNRGADDWDTYLNPLSLCSGTMEYLPSYVFDSLERTIRFTCESQPCTPVEGTSISVGLDYFEQGIPHRTLADIKMLAQHYHLCNPHAEFHWNVEMNNQVWKRSYPSQTGRVEKFCKLAPVQWYSLAAFKELLEALYRSQDGGQSLAISTICDNFSGFNNPNPATDTTQAKARVIQEIGQQSFTKEEMGGPKIKTLYTTMCKFSSPFNSSLLGRIGQKYIYEQLSNIFSISGKIHYAAVTDEENDPGTPFVIEAAVAYLEEGKRQVWTAINFSPTYGDPFLSRRFQPPAQPSESVLGLRGLLDAYGFREETPMILFLHLICPNIEYDEFSKTEINHLPFKKVLGELLDKLLKDLRQGQEEDEMRLEEAAFQALNIIMEKLSVNERFIPEQLLEALRLQLSQNPALLAWLEKPDSNHKLSRYITNYQSYNPEINLFIARQSEVMLHVPLHPESYFSIPLEQVSRELLEKHSVNKLLYIQSIDIEPVILTNNWLCRMDMALLQTTLDTNAVEEILLHCIHQSEMRILLFHNGEDRGYNLVARLREQLQRQRKNTQYVVDVQPPRGTGTILQPTRVMPGELEKRFVERLQALHIPVKRIPSRARMIQDIRTHFEQLLRDYVMEEIEQHLELTSLMMEFDRVFSSVEKMREKRLDERIIWHHRQDMKTESYNLVIHKSVEEFFEYFMKEHGLQIQQMVKSRLAQEKVDRT